VQHCDREHTGTLLQACKGVLYFILFDKIRAGYVKEGVRRQHLEVSCRSAINNILKVKISGTRLVIYEDSIKFLLFYRHICMQIADQETPFPLAKETGYSLLNSFLQPQRHA
jgi:hypothetical protein